MADYRENPYRKDFPLLLEEKAAYLDNAATAKRPVCVMEAEKQFYEHSNANPLRGLYFFAYRHIHSFIHHYNFM